MDASVGILFVIFGISFGLQSESKKRWENPCGGTSGGDASWVPPATASPNFELETLNNMEIQFKDASSMINDFKYEYIVKRFQHPRMADILANHHLMHMPVVEMTDEEMEDAKQNMTKTYLETYEKLSIIAVFLEEVLDDEIHDSENEFASSLEGQQSKLYDIMCNLHHVIYHVGSYVANHVTTNVMPESERQPSYQLERYFRDYLVVRDSGKLHSTLETLYKRLGMALQAKRKK